MHSIPNHIAIIMDGNGRWAKKQGFSRTKGHERGAETVRGLTTFCAKVGVKYLTLYAFSTENWKRPTVEVTFLMKLLESYLQNEAETYMKNNIRFTTVGDISKLSKKLQARIAELKKMTAANTSLTQALALNYGAKDEITRAAQKAASAGEITENTIEENLDSAGFGDVDMLVRTGGEKRVSNFLLWQSAYAELFFTDTLFPDFAEAELDGMIKEFQTRQRRFGGL